MTQVGAAPAGNIAFGGLVGAIGGTEAKSCLKTELQGILAKGLLDPEADPRIRRGVVRCAVILFDTIVERLEGWVKLTVPAEATAVVIGVGGARKCRAASKAAATAALLRNTSLVLMDLSLLIELLWPVFPPSQGSVPRRFYTNQFFQGAVLKLISLCHGEKMGEKMLFRLI